MGTLMFASTMFASRSCCFAIRTVSGSGYRSSFTVNGTPVSGRTILPAQAVIVGDDFSFAIEPAV
jgi:hypothetical protein